MTRPKGHWPRGKPRNDPGLPRRQVADILIGLHRACLDTEVHEEPTLRHCADYLEVSDRTLRRWITGRNNPPASAVQGVRRYLRQFTRR